MFDGVKPQYWSCNGETVLKKTQYNEDVANHRALQRVNTDLLAQFSNQIQRAETPPPPPGFLASAVRAVSQFIQQLARPVIQVFTMLAAIPQTIATVFANLGEKVEPRPVLRVEDADGEVVWSMEVERERVLDPKVAYIMVDMLRDVVDAGSGRSIRDPFRGNVPDTLAVAGKTGTTNDGTDVWFAGFTPDLLAVVWLGFDMRTAILPNAAGGAYAAPAWADFIRPLYFGTQGYEDIDTGTMVEGESATRAIPPPWLMPEGITTRTIDAQSGKLATEWCPPEALREEIYLPGTEPTEACDLHTPGLFGVPMRGLPQVPVDTMTDPLPDSVPPGGLPRPFPRP